MARPASISPGARRPWTPEELGLLESGLTVGEVASRTARSPAAVRQMRQSRGLTGTGPDSAGHWPKGKRRHEAVRGEWPALRDALRELLAAHPLRNVRSYAAVGRAVGVDKTTVGKWLRGEDWPDPRHLMSLRQYSAEQLMLVRRGS